MDHCLLVTPKLLLCCSSKPAASYLAIAASGGRWPGRSLGWSVGRSLGGLVGGVSRSLGRWGRVRSGRICFEIIETNLMHTKKHLYRSVCRSLACWRNENSYSLVLLVTESVPRSLGEMKTLILLVAESVATEVAW